MNTSRPNETPRTAILDALARMTGYTREEIARALQAIANPAEAALPQECREHKCTYYTHYQVYFDPDRHGKELTHEAFHAAEVQCDHWQKRAQAWLDEHKGDRLPMPGSLEKQCVYWEKKICA